MSEAGFPGRALLRVTALQPVRRRAGLVFHQSEPRDLAPGDLGTGIASLMAIAAILSDPQLTAVLVEGDEQREITAEERESLLSIIEAETLRVDPASPPTSEAGETGGAADAGSKSEPAAAAAPAKPQDTKPAAAPPKAKKSDAPAPD